MDWLRWHHGTATDPKWRTVARRAGVRVSDVVAVWTTLLEDASQSETRGELTSWCAEDVAAALDLETEEVERIYEAMEGKVREANTLTGWAKRQPKREDSSTERVRRHREKERREKRKPADPTPENVPDEAPTDADETQCNAPEEIRGEKRTTTPFADAKGDQGRDELDPETAALLDRHRLTPAALKAHRGEAAQIIRKVWWQGKKPPSSAPRAGWHMGCELAIWEELCQNHHPEEVNGGLRRARDALKGELRAGALTLAVLRQSGKRDLLERAIAFWRKEEASPPALNNLELQ